MNQQKIGITADCVCDLPRKMLQEYQIDVIPFHIITDTGRFRDMTEITSNNILEYIESGHKAMSVPPSTADYLQFFTNELNQYDYIIHITITGQISDAYENACHATLDLEGKVSIIDSHHLSTGMGHLLMKASKMREAGDSAAKIEEKIIKMREKISTSFIAYNADYLFYNGLISKAKASFCNVMKIHPVLKITKSGQMSMGGFYIGDYESAAKSYIANLLKHRKNIDRSCLFITHAGCTTKMLDFVKNEVESYHCNDNIIITSASATVSSNCGPNAFGVLFIEA